VSQTRSVFGTLAVLSALARGTAAQTPAPNLVDVGGHKLNVQVAGSSKPGPPTIVFEAGLGSTLASWNGINLTVADSARTIAYERAGIGASEPGIERANGQAYRRRAPHPLGEDCRTPAIRARRPFVRRPDHQRVCRHLSQRSRGTGVPRSNRLHANRRRYERDLGTRRRDERPRLAASAHE
jgi:hypothetical protein